MAKGDPHLQEQVSAQEQGEADWPRNRLSASERNTVLTICLLLNLSRILQQWVVGFPFAGKPRRSWRCASTCSSGVQTRRRCWLPCHVFATSVRRLTSAVLRTKSLSRLSCPTTPPLVNWPLSAT